MQQEQQVPEQVSASEVVETAEHVHGPNCQHGHHDHHHHHHNPDEMRQPIMRSSPKVGRNDPCLCGSQKKFKKCHGQ